jgi:hypothetical protein
MEVTMNDSTCQSADYFTKKIHHFFKRMENFVLETFSDFFPNLLNGIHFRSSWRKKEQLNVGRNFKRSGFVP